MKTYLAGPINGRSDADCNDWREEAKRLLLCETLDPMSRDYRGREGEALKEIVEGDKKDISDCDVLLVYFDRPSVGTSMEVLYAWQNGKTVAVVNASGKALSPWLVYHSRGRVYDDLQAAIADINGYLRITRNATKG